MKQILLIALFLLGISNANGQTVNVSNSKNPYDQVGKFHNEALDYVNAKVGFKKGTNFRPIISDFLLTKFKKSEVENYRTSTLPLEKKLSEVASKYYKDLIAIINGNYNVGETMNRIKKLEDLILVNKPKIPGSEFKSLLAATSTARYSNFYWATKDNNGNIPSPSYKIRILKWIKIIFEDVSGVLNSDKDTCGAIGDGAEASCNAASN